MGEPGPAKQTCAASALQQRRPGGAWQLDAKTNRGEPAIARANSRRNLVFGDPTQEPNHEATIRFGGKAPRRRAHSNERFDDHVLARVTTTSDRDRPVGQGISRRARRNGMLVQFVYGAGQSAGRSTTPLGTSPLVTMRQSAMSSLRASATIIFVLRAPLGPSVLLRNHRVSALSF